MKYFLFSILICFAFYSCADNKSNDIKNELKNSTSSTTQSGETLFAQNCKMCHSTSATGDYGNAPILDSVKFHWSKKEDLIKYIKNPKENLNTNNYTTALYEKWKTKPQMPPFMGLSDDEINNLIDYLYSVSK